MREFNWETAKEIRSPQTFEYLLQNFDRKVTEEEYINEMGLIKRFIVSKSGKHGLERRALKRGYQISRMKKDYKNLKSKFGFFK